jgi:DNA-binding response OmpR family regulator
MRRILLVEDDNRVAAALVPALERHGYAVVRVATGAEALAAPPVDLVLLDLGLPDLDGLEVCRRLRRGGDVPIIAVTARAEANQRIRGLRSGADDYVVKPYALGELLARIEAVLRRSPRRTTAAAYTVGDVVVDLAGRCVRVGGVEVRLTLKEFDLLAMLARAAGSVVSRDDLVTHVWQTTFDGASRTLDVHVATLRAKLDRPGLIETVRGVGYRLATTSEAVAPHGP